MTDNVPALEKIQQELQEIRLMVQTPAFKHKLTFAQLCEELGIGPDTYKRRFRDGVLTVPPPGDRDLRGRYSYDDLMSCRQELSRA